MGMKKECVEHEEATMSRVIHFEIHASKPEALIDFYTALLGWSLTKQEAMDYWLIETGPADQPGINGGLVRRPVAGPAESQAVNAFICTVQVDSLGRHTRDERRARRGRRAAEDARARHRLARLRQGPGRQHPRPAAARRGGRVARRRRPLGNKGQR